MSNIKPLKPTDVISDKVRKFEAAIDRCVQEINAQLRPALEKGEGVHSAIYVRLSEPLFTSLTQHDGPVLSETINRYRRNGWAVERASVRDWEFHVAPVDAENASPYKIGAYPTVDDPERKAVLLEVEGGLSARAGACVFMDRDEVNAFMSTLNRAADEAFAVEG